MFEKARERKQMHVNWTDPDNGIEYEIEFIVTADVDASGNLIPAIDSVLSMTAGTVEVDFDKPINKIWFETHSKSIFDSCHKRIEEDDEYDD
jgi:hypothetical protein